MALSIVPLEDARREQVVDYFKLHNKPEEVTLWKYYDAAFNRGRRRGYVWLKNDQVHGFIGLIPFQLAHQERRFDSAWTCDWSLREPNAAPGAGVLLFKKAIEASPRLATFYGNENTKKIVPRLATLTVEDAALRYWQPLRLSPLLDRLKLRVLKSDRAHAIDAFGVLPAPRRQGWLPSREARVAPSLPAELAPLFEQPQASAWYPHYDFETLRWQLERCPTIESASVLSPSSGPARAAAVIWHVRGSAEWRVVLAQEPGAEDLVPMVLAQAARAAWQKGGNTLTTLVSGLDRLYQGTLAQQLFFRADERYPLYLFKPPEDPMPLFNLQRINYLATDMASIG